MVEGLIIISQESYFETTPTGSKFHPGVVNIYFPICINIANVSNNISSKYMYVYNYFVEICFGRVTHYYLRLAESYLEEREAELGQSIKQKPTGEISTQEVT